MGKSAVKGLFYICLIAATFVLATITIVAAFSGNVAPVDSVIMPLLGLAVPVLLIVNLITALCWALARKRWALVPLVAFPSATGISTSVFSPPAERQNPGRQVSEDSHLQHTQLRGEITGYSCKEIARYMQQKGVDVLCFQEFGDNSDFPTDGIRRILSHWSHALIPSEDSRAYCLSPYSALYPLANHRFITYQQSSNMMCDADGHGYHTSDKQPPARSPASAEAQEVETRAGHRRHPPRSPGQPKMPQVPARKLHEAGHADLRHQSLR